MKPFEPVEPKEDGDPSIFTQWIARVNEELQRLNDRLDKLDGQKES